MRIFRLLGWPLGILVATVFMAWWIAEEVVEGAKEGFEWVQEAMVR